MDDAQAGIRGTKNAKSSQVTWMSSSSPPRRRCVDSLKFNRMCANVWQLTNTTARRVSLSLSLFHFYFQWIEFHVHYYLFIDFHVVDRVCQGVCQNRTWLSSGHQWTENRVKCVLEVISSWISKRRFSMLCVCASRTAWVCSRCHLPPQQQ